MFTRRAAALVGQRQDARHQVEAALVDAAGTETGFAAVLEDISCFGCRLSGAPPLTAGERLWVRLPDGTVVETRIAWSRGDEAGCRFAEPIASGLMRSLLPGAV
jgi:hypothetical protein